MFENSKSLSALGYTLKTFHNKINIQQFQWEIYISHTRSNSVMLILWQALVCYYQGQL